MRKSYPPRGSFMFDPETQVQRPVFGFDIDGTMGFYHEHFINFAQEWLGRPLPDPSQFDGSTSLAKFISVSKSTYRKIKLAYRKGGMKRSMPYDQMMVEIVGTLRKRGAEIIIATTRPYLSLENIDEDTRHWLKRARVPHDEVIWGENKYRDLAQARPGRVLLVVDDLPEMIKQAHEVGLPAVMIERPHNLAYRQKHPYDKEFDWRAVLDICEEMMTEWEEANR